MFNKVKILKKFLIATVTLSFGACLLFLCNGNEKTLALPGNEQKKIHNNLSNLKSSKKIKLYDLKNNEVLDYELSSSDINFFKRILSENYRKNLKEEFFVSKVINQLLRVSNINISDEVKKNDILNLRKEIISKALKKDYLLKVYDEKGNCIYSGNIGKYSKKMLNKFGLSEGKDVLDFPAKRESTSISDQLKEFRKNKSIALNNKIYKPNKEEDRELLSRSDKETIVQEDKIKHYEYFFKEYCKPELIEDNVDDMILYFTDNGSSHLVNQAGYIVFSPTYFYQKYNIPEDDKYFYNVCYEIEDENHHKYREQSDKSVGKYGTRGIHLELQNGNCAFMQPTIGKDGQPTKFDAPFTTIEPGFKFENGKKYTVRLYKNNSFDKKDMIVQNVVTAVQDSRNLFSRLGTYTFFYNKFKHTKEFNKEYYEGREQFFKNLRKEGQR